MKEEPLIKKYDPEIMRKILSFSKPYTLHMTIAVIALLLATAAELLLPVVIKTAIDGNILTPDPDPAALTAKGVLYFFLLLAVLLFSFVQVYLLAFTGQMVMKDIRVSLYNHIIRQSLNFMSKTPVGSLVSRVTNDVETLNEFFTSVAASVLKDFSLIIGVLVTIFFLNTRLALITALSLPPVFIAAAVFRAKARNAYRRVRSSVARVNAFLSEHIMGMEIIQMFGREESTGKAFGKENEVLLRAQLLELYVFAFFRPLMNLFTSVTVGVVIYFGSSRVQEGDLSLGVLIAFLSLVQKFYRPVLDFAEKFTILQSAMAGGERVFSLMEESEIIEDTGKGKSWEPGRGKIEFKNVSFSYKQGEPVLKNLSFTVYPGETAAIAGYTGAGKTTIANLLTRMWEIDEGEICIDGVNIQDIPLEDLRKGVIPVQQDVFLFAESIEENVRAGLDLTEEQTAQAARAAQAAGFIEKLPGKYRFDLSENAANISTGQRQLLSFARVLARNPAIIILDEATGSIDTETEKNIQKAVERLTENRTSLVIAHRLSTIRHADRILVLGSGRVQEEGTHEELLSKKGLYYNLYKLQYTR
ncbi:MAG: ABC transporter ATP-binding protein [Spirochaetes bacterium]|nr:MAG: ABC transporter ATP-binding protein [Spirochaetota bacterium]